MGDIVGKAFSLTDKHTKSTHRHEENLPKGDLNRMANELIQTLREKLLDSLNDSMEPNIRAHTLTKVIDAFLRTPSPYPKGFMSLKTIPTASAYVAAKDPFAQGSSNGSKDTYTKLSLERNGIYKVELSHPLGLRISGSLPGALLKCSDLPFSQIVTSCSFSFDGPLNRDYDVDWRDGATLGEVGNHLDKFVVTSSSELLPASPLIYGSDKETSGSNYMVDCECPMFQREGYYQIEVSLLLRDIRCGEWSVITNLSGDRLTIACINN